MLRHDGIVKVLDFGLAKLSETANSGQTFDAEAATKLLVQTEPGVVMGTAAYMSPEQARGKDVDARTDIFSLGAVIYEMLSGHAPFAGETGADIIGALIHKEPPPLANLVSNIPSELQHIISKALRKDRDERYQTVKSLLTDLKAVKHDLDFADKLDRSVAPNNSDIPLSSTESAADGNASTQTSLARPTSSVSSLVSRLKNDRVFFAGGLALLLLAVIGFGYWRYSRSGSNAAPIESIAVLPFVNETGGSDVEYLSDGMTESLINSLSQLPKLSVKARSSVFRYKSKEVEPQQVAAELSVQAVLNGRVVQRGDDLALYLSLVDARTGNQIWGEQYNRKLTDLVALQKEIARDVSQKLRARLSGADVQKLTKNYTANVEAYQLYLKGRYHFVKLTVPELQTAISNFQKAIDLDPTYAPAYVGLSNAYRAVTISTDRPANELLPKAKLMAQKAVEIDDALAEAHSALGSVTFFYDWNWNEAESEFKRALQLDPNSSDTHQLYALLLTGVGRQTEAVAESHEPENLIL
jgi:serine/threonine-protein kinase